MHELALCQSIDRIVRRAAGERTVAVVEVQIGALRQVVPETLERCWTVVSSLRGSPGPAMETTFVPAVVSCRDCGALTSIDAPILVCGSCSSANVDVVQGDEFMVTALRLEVDNGAISSA